MAGLSAEQLEQWDQDGFVSPIDVLTEDEAAAALADFERAEHEHPAALDAEYRNNAHLTFPLLADLALHPTVVACVESILGPDLMLWSSVLFVKEPSSKGYVSWHQDGTYMSLDPVDIVTPWIALTPSTLDSGCMSMIPGSHRSAVREHHDTFADDNILTRGQEVRDIDPTTAAHLELRPGQMSLHHGLVVHGSQPNRSNHRRVGYAAQAFIPHHVRQTKGHDFAMWAAGAPVPSHFEEVPRPTVEMDPAAVALRQRVNNNYAAILYDGAAQKREY